jgi:membrane-associated phospholipid phosphatase
MAIVPGVLLAWLVLAVVFGFTDLQISLAVVDPESRMGRFVARYGEIPGLATLVFGLFVVLVDRTRRRLPLDLLLALLLITLTSLVAYYASALLVSYLVGSFDFYTRYGRWVWLALGLLVLAGQWAVSDYRFPHRIDRFARVAVGVALLNFGLFVNICKPLWGRVRFQDLAPGYADFTPWYLPQGVTGHHSFPSGHAAAGWLLLPLILLVRDRPRSVRISVAALAIAWGAMVATGRVVIGAHYASDVLFTVRPRRAVVVGPARNDLATPRDPITHSLARPRRAATPARGPAWR